MFCDNLQKDPKSFIAFDEIINKIHKQLNKNSYIEANESSSIKTIA